MFEKSTIKRLIEKVQETTITREREKKKRQSFEKLDTSTTAKQELKAHNLHRLIYIKSLASISLQEGGKRV